jgi:glycosyltransferase involved in cell wall biosynthesis
MLTADRPALARHAVECFRRQTYAAKRLFVLDTGADPCMSPELQRELTTGIYVEHYPPDCMIPLKTIGELRNWANSYAHEDCLAGDIIVHFDDDDYSHPNRIAEQVAMLESSGADAVGYNEMLFYDDRKYCAGCHEVVGSQHRPSCPRQGIVSLASVYSGTPGETWLYTGSILGTSLCYWRRTWDRVPFRAQRLNPRHDPGVGEDQDFLLDLAAAGMKSEYWPAFGRIKYGYTELPYDLATGKPDGRVHAEANGVNEYADPRMVARIHAGNTSNAYDPAQMAAHPQHWRRVPEWDTYCRSMME